MKERTINLKPVWSAILEVYQEIAKICERHGLRYYVTDGTAIGAIRHHGFIPWDDDFDMSMPREDYDKFIAYAKTELPSYLKFVNWQNTPEFSLLFGQVHDSRREKVAAVEKACGYELSLGIYVDIIPIDGYPESCLERWFVRKYAYLLRSIWRAKGGVFSQQSCRGKILMCIGKILSILMPWIQTQTDVLAICEKLLRRHPFNGSRYSGRASVYLTGLNRPPLPSSWWGMGKMVDFENIKVPVPQDYDAFLRFYFHDYMKLPPLEKRCPSHEYSYKCAWCYGPTAERLAY